MRVYIASASTSASRSAHRRATLHDLLVTLAFLAFFRYDMTLNVIAALLTITGYSVNDTIVIFDRVRENARLLRRDPRQRRQRRASTRRSAATIITAGTTLLAVLALYLFGGEVLRGFAFTMLVGIISGTYSTVFIAAAIAIILSRPQGRAAAAPPRRPRKHGRRSDRARGGSKSASRLRATASDRRPPDSSTRTGQCAALLGAVQGLTEFLPVSSSAHLILARASSGWDAEPLRPRLRRCLPRRHAGSPSSRFPADFGRHGGGAAAALTPRATTRSGPRASRWLIIVGTIPSWPSGWPWRLPRRRSARPRWRPSTLALVRRRAAHGGAARTPRTRRPTISLGRGGARVGIAQAAALIPGVSRSGATDITIGPGLRPRSATPRPGSRSCWACRRCRGRGERAGSRSACQGTTSQRSLVAVGTRPSIVGYPTVRTSSDTSRRHRLDVFA